MMDKPCVDVLLATYEGAQFLPEQLDSIERQSYPHLHVIARDDGSKDQSLNLLKNRPFECIDSDKNLGCKRNFSKLLEHAQAPYICFSDQDDVWLSHKVEESLQAMQKAEKSLPVGTPVLVHTDLVVVDQSLQEVSPSFWNYAGLNPHEHATFNRLLVQNCVTGCAMMINRPLADLTSSIPQEAKMHDWWLALVAAAFGKIVAINRPSILYRQHAHNAIGAQKSGLTKAFERFWSGNLTQARIDRKKQAETFFSRFQNRLTEEQKNVLITVIEADEHSWLKNALNAYRHGIYRTGLLSNSARFLMKNPF